MLTVRRNILESLITNKTINVFRELEEAVNLVGLTLTYCIRVSAHQVCTFGKSKMRISITFLETYEFLTTLRQKLPPYESGKAMMEGLGYGHLRNPATYFRDAGFSFVMTFGNAAIWITNC